MRNLNELNHARDWKQEIRLYGMNGNHECGCFQLLSRDDAKPLRIIASSGEGWDHVSVSRTDHVPSYADMQYIARTFFKEDETAVQFHVPKSEHVNVHPHCLHWWRPLNAVLPKPPTYMIG